jgi:hypothetical protein
MNKIVIGVGFVFSGVTLWVYKNQNNLRNYLIKTYGFRNIDALGYIGGAMQLGAVLAVSRGWLENTSAAYHGISLLGSTGLLLTTFIHEAMAPVIVNTIWMGMNTVGLLEKFTQNIRLPYVPSGYYDMDGNDLALDWEMPE